VSNRRGNLFDDIPRPLREELVERIGGSGATRVERIVSRGQASPRDFWYDQDEDEWVVLLAGAARLRFEGEGGDVTLAPGDYVEIPAHTRHRVVWTDPTRDTVWLAVFYTEETE
jgi:cupin 2 domain-containing protein